MNILIILCDHLILVGLCQSGTFGIATRQRLILPTAETATEQKNFTERIPLHTYIRILIWYNRARHKCLPPRPRDRIIWSSRERRKSPSRKSCFRCGHAPADLPSCRRCHTHKIKCSGEQPCTKCRNAGCAAECNYVNRDRQIKVHERWV
jgi:hypothetical protein